MADGNGVHAHIRRSKHPTPTACDVCASPKHSTGWHEAQLERWAHHDWDEYVDRARSRTFKPVRRPKPGAVLIGVATLAQNTRDAIELLADDPGLYQRAGELVRVVRVTETEAARTDDTDGLGQIMAGTPFIKSVPEANLRARMSEYVPCEKLGKKGEIVDCNPDYDLVHSILTWTEYPSVRLIRGIAEAPFFRGDGTVCQDPGYDTATGYHYVPSMRFPMVPERPTQEDAIKAFKKLRHVYAGLEFADDAARACPIAGILAIFAQAAIRGCIPIFMTEANSPGTGKTITGDAIGIIAAGRPMPRRSFPGPGEELRKVLDAYAKDGTRFFCLDNIGQDFGGEAIEAAVTTEGHYDLRVLGKTENMRVEWNTIIFGTGNNIGFCRPDIVPRTLMSRMETKSEDPRGRDVSTFLIKENLLQYVRRNRAGLVVAALTMLRAFHVAGRPAQDCKPWGSFEAFRDLVIQAIVFAGGPDVSACRLTGSKALASDSDTMNLKIVLEHLPKLYDEKNAAWMSCGQILEFLYVTMLHDHSYDSLRAGLEGLTSKKRTGDVKPNATGLGYAFARYRAKVVGGFRLADQFDKHLGINTWRVEIVKDGIIKPA